MNLKVIGSSSKGNCYLIENETEGLIIECGVSVKAIKKEIDDLGKIKGCLISHRHIDHKASASAVSRFGVQVYANADVIDSDDIIMPVEAVHGKTYYAGGFAFTPFNLNHNVPNLGYLIYHKDIGRILFATDTDDIPYEFKDPINHFMIEANYSVSNLISNRVNIQHGQRVIKDHMSIERSCEIVSSHENVQNVILIHLSDGNSHSDEFQVKMQKASGAVVYVADKGMNIKL